MVKDDYHVLVGTYTAGCSRGIHRYRLRCEPFTCHEQYFTPADSPSYLILSRHEDIVYAVHEVGPERPGEISAYGFDPVSGVLSYRNTVTTGGADPCHVHESPDGKFVFVSNYSGGSLAVIPRDDSGTLGAPLQVIQYGGGSGAVPSRQVGAHVHFAITSPDGRFLFVCDLGNDCLYRYPLNEHNARAPLDLNGLQRIALPFGSGPRQVKFSASGQQAYVMGELDGCIYTFDYCEGALTLRHRIALAEAGCDESHGGGELILSDDDQYLYASNRGTFDEIVTFAINADGSLRRQQRVSTEGIMPRHFDMTLNGRHLLVGNQESGTIELFDRDPVNGQLSHAQQQVLIDQPACVLLIPVRY